MQITKYAQSCILIETNGKRILIDPGYLEYDESLLKNDWHDIDILLITHKHTDHCHIPAILEILKNKNTTLYTSQEVVNEYSELKEAKVVKENDIVEIDNIKIEVTKAIHGYIPLLKGGKEVYENIGYIIQAENKKIYLTSDTICFDNDYKCDILFIPVSNHGLVMDSFSASLFAQEVGAELIVPTHYDNPRFPVKLEEVEEKFKKQNLNYKILAIKETIEL